MSPGDIYLYSTGERALIVDVEPYCRFTVVRQTGRRLINFCSYFPLSGKIINDGISRSMTPRINGEEYKHYKSRLEQVGLWEDSNDN